MFNNSSNSSSRTHTYSKYFENVTCTIDVLISDEYKSYAAAVTNTLTSGFVTLCKIDVKDHHNDHQLPWQHVNSDIQSILILAELEVGKHLLDIVSAISFY